MEYWHAAKTFLSTTSPPTLYLFKSTSFFHGLCPSRPATATAAESPVVPLVPDSPLLQSSSSLRGTWSFIYYTCLCMTVQGAMFPSKMCSDFLLSDWALAPHFTPQGPKSVFFLCASIRCYLGQSLLRTFHHFRCRSMHARAHVQNTARQMCVGEAWVWRTY